MNHLIFLQGGFQIHKNEKKKKRLPAVSLVSEIVKRQYCEQQYREGPAGVCRVVGMHPTYRISNVEGRHFLVPVLHNLIIIISACHCCVVLTASENMRTPTHVHAKSGSGRLQYSSISQCHPAASCQQNKSRDLFRENLNI